MPPSLCPCQLGARHYAPGSAIMKDCNHWMSAACPLSSVPAVMVGSCTHPVLPSRRTAMFGMTWPCVPAPTGQQCSERCQASGAPPYVTFDGLALTFPRACEYLLVRDSSGQFTVSAQNLPCGASQTVMVNGVSVTLPKVYTGPGLGLRRAGLFLLLTTCLGLTLLWDGGQALA
ncbi:hypothetical protein MC885_019191 [Smutsia gigantea]|nr:hypothetical protein MC885_019191 [Smutsia gigantea]